MMDSVSRRPVSRTRPECPTPDMTMYACVAKSWSTTHFLAVRGNASDARTRQHICLAQLDAIGKLLTSIVIQVAGARRPITSRKDAERCTSRIRQPAAAVLRSIHRRRLASWQVLCTSCAVPLSLKGDADTACVYGRFRRQANVIL